MTNSINTLDKATLGKFTQGNFMHGEFIQKVLLRIESLQQVSWLGGFPVSGRVCIQQGNPI